VVSLAAVEGGRAMGAWSPWENANYCWVVICKNKRFHKHTNVMFGHKIPLGEADAVSPPPALNGQFLARCDECGKEYDYEPEEVMRVEPELPASFTAHELFKENAGPFVICARRAPAVCLQVVGDHAGD
jgi:hypothetical protein